MRARLPIYAVAALALLAAPGLAEDKKPFWKKTNALTADNGLGAAALGELGLTVGAALLADPQPWRGFDLGQGAGLPVNGSPDYSADCASDNAAAIARALTATPPPAAPPAGVIRMERPSTSEPAPAYDMKAIYQQGQSVSCPAKPE